MADRFEVVREIRAPNVNCDRCGQRANPARVCRLPKSARIWHYCLGCAHHQAVAFGVIDARGRPIPAQEGTHAE